MWRCVNSHCLQSMVPQSVSREYVGHNCHETMSPRFSSLFSAPGQNHHSQIQVQFHHHELQFSATKEQRMIKLLSKFAPPYQACQWKLCKIMICVLEVLRSSSELPYGLPQQRSYGHSRQKHKRGIRFSSLNTHEKSRSIFSSTQEHNMGPF